jgi:hypothetical protein
MAKISQNISQERVSRIVESASDILGSVESEHIVAVIGNLVKGATQIMDRFTQPFAPLEHLDASARGPSSIPIPARISFPVDGKK